MRVRENNFIHKFQMSWVVHCIKQRKLIIHLKFTCNESPRLYIETIYEADWESSRWLGSHSFLSKVACLMFGQNWKCWNRMRTPKRMNLFAPMSDRNKKCELLWNLIDVENNEVKFTKQKFRLFHGTHCLTCLIALKVTTRKIQLQWFVLDDKRPRNCTSIFFWGFLRNALNIANFVMWYLMS